MTFTTTQPSNHRLSINSLPTIDLRLLSQSELTALSLSSTTTPSADLRRYHDVVIPKIDPVVFNESAGSRKQTFSRLRLAPRNTLHHRNGDKPHSSLSPLDSDNSRIISLFKTLFENNNGDMVANTMSKALITMEENVEYSNELFEKEERERERELVNGKGEMVDLTVLGNVEDPYGEEIRRRTEGKESAEELLGFISELEGKWGSRRKKRKIVDANLFGNCLPNGWKLLIAMKKKQGRVFVFCRRYISPNGRYFVSCKEVSSYLLSLTSPQDIKQQPTVEGLKNAVENNKLAPESATDLGEKVEDPSLHITPKSNEDEHVQNSLSISGTIDQEKQLSLVTNILPGEQKTTPSLKCHKCSTSFSEKDELLNHLLSCHKRKRRKTGTPIEDDFMMKDGKYECQFCNKVFLERSSYFGHVGMHVKNYVKIIGGSHRPKSLAEQKDCALTVAENLLENGQVCQNDVEMNMEAAQSNIIPVDESNNIDETALTNENKPKEVEESDKYSVSEGNSNENNDLCEIFGEINTTDHINSEVIKTSPEPIDNEENDRNISVNILQTGIKAYESDFLFGNNETLSSDQNTDDRSLVINHIQQSCSLEDLDDVNDQLMDGSDSGQLDMGFDSGQGSGNLDETSDILHVEEEAKRFDFLESNANSSCSPSGDQFTIEPQDFIGVTCGPEVGTSSLEDGEVILDADVAMAREQPEACDSLQSKDVDCGYIVNEDDRVSHMALVDSRERVGFPLEQTCTLMDSPRELSSRISEEPKSNQDINPNLYFPSEISDRHLSTDVTVSNDQTHGNLLGAFGNFIEDKQEEVPKSTLSSLSIDHCMSEVTLNELDKVDTSRTNELIFDFGSITDINSRFLGSVQNETISDETSPFSIWGQQTCIIEDHQNGDYGSIRGASQQESCANSNSFDVFAPQQTSDVGYNSNKVCSNEQRYGVKHNENEVYRKNSETEREGIYGNSLNLVGFQQPPNSGFNLNKVLMNDQSYNVQRNESNVYRKNIEVRTNGISHGNTLNLAGFQQQCETEYNLSKSYINQQSYGLHYNESRAYSSTDKSKQERVTYGNSLSLVSFPQTCESRYNMNKSCIPQRFDSDFGLNKGYMGTIRDRDLMVGFWNNSGRPSQSVATDFFLPGGLMDSSSSQGQPSGSYQAFDFLSDKGVNNLYTTNEKFDNISSFQGQRPTNVEPMEFTFMTTQDSNSHMGHKSDLSSYNNAQINQNFGSTIWHQKQTLPNIMGGNVSILLCVWCGSEFYQDSLSCELQAGSIGYLCPTCKARMSGQFL